MYVFLFIFQIENFLNNLIIIQGGISSGMSFVLSDGETSETAPFPKDSSRIALSDEPGQTLAYMEFPGIATDSEVQLQSSLLVNSLNADGIEFDPRSMKVFQYNPPYTLPWLRTNAVTYRILQDYESEVDDDDNETAKKRGYYSSPEAGD